MATPDWLKNRTYLHFDFPPPLQSVCTYVCDPDRVAKHAFYPFIYFEINSEKVRFDNETQRLRITRKIRPLSYAAHMDSHIYSYYAHILTEKYETYVHKHGLSNCILAFRSLNGKCNIDFAKDAFDAIRQKAPCHVICLDISGFFDNLDHCILKREWCALLGEAKLPNDHYNVYKSIIDYCRIDKNKLYQELKISKHRPRAGNRKRLCESKEFRDKVRPSVPILNNKQDRKGIPQGAALSSVLSNIYMNCFDKAMNAYTQRIHGAYMRYCDDILIIVPQSESAEAIRKAKTTIGDLRLEINDSKTDECDFNIDSTGIVAEKPIQYLGFIFDGKRILIRSASIARYYQRLRKGIKLAKKTRDKHNQIRSKHGLNERELYLKKLYSKYSYVGRRNFISYGYRAANIMDGSPSIKKQLKPFWRRLRTLLEEP